MRWYPKNITDLYDIPTPVTNGVLKRKSDDSGFEWVGATKIQPSQDADFVEFTGLTKNRYLLEYSMRQTATSTQYLQMILNGDETLANYACVYMLNTTTGGVNNSYIGYNQGFMQTIMLGQVLIVKDEATISQGVAILTNAAQVISPSTASSAILNSVVKYAIDAPISSIKIRMTTSPTVKITAGSTFNLYQ